MEITTGNITTTTDEYIREDILMTYSEEEQQQNKEYREHSKLLYTPEFIPYYVGIQKLYKLTQSETIIYGFIRFYLNNSPNGKFYFTDEQLSEILLIGESTISNSISKLATLGVINKQQLRKSNGGTKRLISNFISYRPETLKTGVIKTQKLGTNNNIIIYIKSKTELLNLIENNGITNELYILGIMIDLGYKLSTDKQEIENGVARVKSMMSRYIPRKEDGKLDWNKAKAETEDRYIYWSNPPKGKKKPTNFQLSLTNWVKPKERKK